MPLKVSRRPVARLDPKDREEPEKYAYYLSGDNGFADYERKIFYGEIPCPFTVEFRDADGNIVSTEPIPLNLRGIPKVNPYRKEPDAQS